ncbi:hypothetical protein [Nocardia bovistercoris]|uniref:Uncharacterized protein n=1 Tax=Nocardia bovistercoris TaxID=2785916 RepID=A0A931IFE2_9NOCA|nr:hypothetical protein [Nocardia bovistercoris]MBH0778780.1 hypothetical protein [Nocardia bovistercoris]
MTPDEVLILLQVAQSYDSRNIDRLMQSAWLDAATRMRWQRDAALEAVRSHYATSTERIMPAHVTGLIRAARPVAFAPQYRSALTSAPPASPEGRSAARALFASGRRTQEPRIGGLRRRRRTEPLPDGVEVGPEPQRAFVGDLCQVLDAKRSDQ